MKDWFELKYFLYFRKKRLQSGLRNYTVNKRLLKKYVLQENTIFLLHV